MAANIQLTFWNARTLTPHKWNTLIYKHLPLNKNTIIFISESRITQSTILTLTKTHTIISNELHTLTFAIPLHTTVTDTTINTEFALGVTLNIWHTNINIIGTHLANNASTRTRQAHHITHTIKHINTPIIVGGDFNDITSKLDTDKQNPHIPQYTHTYKSWGVDIWRYHNPSLYTPTHFHDNTQTPTPHTKQYTQNRLDRIYTKNLDVTLCTTHIINTPSLSDHAAVTATITFPYCSPPTSLAPRPKVSLFPAPTHDPPFYMRRTPPFPCPLSFLKQLKSLLKYRPQLPDKTLSQIDKFNKHHATTNLCINTPPTITQVNSLIKTCRFNNIVSVTPSTPSVRESVKIVQYITQQHSTLTRIQTPTDTLVHPDTITQYLLEQTEILFKANSSHTITNFTPFQLDKETIKSLDITNTTRQGISATINTLARKKTRGPDGILAEEYLPYVDYIIDYINRHASTSTPPPQTHLNTLTNYITKPNSPSPPKFTHLRPICIETSITRIISLTISKLLKKITHQLAGPHQHGFVPHRSAHTLIHTLNHLTHQNYTVIFLDFEKAFTNTNTHTILHTLHNINLPPTTLAWLTHILKPYNTHIIHNNKISSKTAHINSGLRQGNSLSPILFSIYIHIFYTKLKNIFPHLDIFFFADDGAIAFPPSTSHNIILNCIQTLFTIASELGMPINVNKTKTINFEHPLNKFENIKTFKYLGIIIPFSPLQNNPIDIKIEKTYKLINFLKSLSIQPIHGAYIFNTFIISQFTYALTHININKQQTQTIEWFARALTGYTRGHSFYLGRPITQLELPLSKGGLNIRNITLHSLCCKNFWNKVQNNLIDMPPTNTKIPLPNVKPHPVTQTSKTLYKALLNAQHTQPPSPQELVWHSIHSHCAPLLSPTQLSIIWKFHFRILPVEEHFRKHFDITTLTPCRLCGTPTLWGPTHLLTCTNAPPTHNQQILKHNITHIDTLTKAQLTHLISWISYMTQPYHLIRKRANIPPNEERVAKKPKREDTPPPDLTSFTQLQRPPHATAQLYTITKQRPRHDNHTGGQIGGDWGELGERPAKRAKTNIRLGPTPKVKTDAN